MGLLLDKYLANMPGDDVNKLRYIKQISDQYVPKVVGYAENKHPVQDLYAYYREREKDPELMDFLQKYQPERGYSANERSISYTPDEAKLYLKSLAGEKGLDEASKVRLQVWDTDTMGAKAVEGSMGVDPQGNYTPNLYRVVPNPSRGRDSSIGDMFASFLTGGTSDWYKGLTTDGSIYDKIDRGIDLGGIVDPLLRGTGESLPQEVRQVAPGAGGMIGNFFLGPMGAAAGAGAGAKIAGQDTQSAMRTASMAALMSAVASGAKDLSDLSTADWSGAGGNVASTGSSLAGSAGKMIANLAGKIAIKSLIGKILGGSGGGGVGGGVGATAGAVIPGLLASYANRYRYTPTENTWTTPASEGAVATAAPVITGPRPVGTAKKEEDEDREHYWDNYLKEYEKYVA